VKITILPLFGISLSGEDDTFFKGFFTITLFGGVLLLVY